MSIATIQQTPTSEPTVVQQRKPELVAHWLFTHFSSWRSLLGLIAIAVLTAISVIFNYQLGKLMASDQITQELFPLGFATLELATLFLASWLSRKSRSIIRKLVAWCWFAFLISLSIWAAMSFTLASDARLVQSGYEQMKQVKLNALEQAEKQVQAAQVAYESTSKFKQLRLNDLREAQSMRDDLMHQVQQLNEVTPHVSLAIYYRTSALLHDFTQIRMSPDELSSLVRMLWALALVLSPFILTSLIAFELGSTSTISHAPVFRGNNGFSPGENKKMPTKFRASKWENFNPVFGKQPNKSSTMEEALRTVKIVDSNLEPQGRALFPDLQENQITDKIDELPQLNRAALANVRNVSTCFAPVLKKLTYIFSKLPTPAWRSSQATPTGVDNCDYQLAKRTSSLMGCSLSEQTGLMNMTAGGIDAFGGPALKRSGFFL